MPLLNLAALLARDLDLHCWGGSSEGLPLARLDHAADSYEQADRRWVWAGTDGLQHPRQAIVWSVERVTAIVDATVDAKGGQEPVGPRPSRPHAGL